jgi:hypothetical protein
MVEVAILRGMFRYSRLIDHNLNWLAFILYPKLLNSFITCEYLQVILLFPPYSCNRAKITKSATTLIFENLK